MKTIKKIFILLFICAFAMFNMTSAKADMSGPEMREFEVVVTSSAGIDYTDYQGNLAGHLNLGDKVYVVYEYDGKYSLGKMVTKYGVESTETFGYVNSLEGFDTVEKEVDPTIGLEDKDIQKFDKEQKAIVYAKDGVDVYSGPSNAYKKVGHLIKGTKLTFKYGIGGFDLTYIYVEYGNVKGWVKILESAVLLENTKQYVFKTDIETECGVIPKNTVTTPMYRTDIWSGLALFKYNDCEVLLNVFKDDKIYQIYGSNNKAKVDLNIYKYADETSEVIGTIPAGSEFTGLAQDGGNYSMDAILPRYVQYNDIKGWIFDSSETSEIVSYNEEPNKIEDTVKVEEEKQEEVVEEEKNTTTNKKIGLNTLIILCGFGVGILVITALVIIILVNRSKKSKKVEAVTEEVKTEETVPTEDTPEEK